MYVIMCPIPLPTSSLSFKKTLDYPQRDMAEATIQHSQNIFFLLQGISHTIIQFLNQTI